MTSAPYPALPFLDGGLFSLLGGSTGVELALASVVVLGFAGLNWLNDAAKRRRK